MKIPTREKAELFLSEAEDRNPGPWVEHSKNVARAAQMIAERHPRLDPDSAYILGLLHDIGRRDGNCDMKHLVIGYYFLHEQGYDEAARISITHSFPLPEISTYVARWDCTPEEIGFIEDFIINIEFTEYDRLIQLCDGIAPAEGFCLLEKRMVDVAIRLGINEDTVRGWKARFQIKADFEDAIGCSIYEVLPGVIQVTFGSIPEAIS